MEQADGSEADAKETLSFPSKGATFVAKVQLFAAEDDDKKAGNGAIPCSDFGCSEVGTGRGIGDLDDMEMAVGLFDDADRLCSGSLRVSEAIANEEKSSESDITEEKVEVDCGAEEASCGLDQTEEMGFFRNCLTPLNNVFDPFASCSGELPLMLAPRKRVLDMESEAPCQQAHCNPCPDNKEDGDGQEVVGIPDADVVEDNSCRPWKPPLRRQIDFDSCCGKLDEIVSMDEFEGDGKEDDEVVEERRFMESIYRLFLEVIVSSQMEESVDVAESQVPSGLKTPTTLQLLSGVPDTCPGAPCRPSPRSRKLTPGGVCRKLDF